MHANSQDKQAGYVITATDDETIISTMIERHWVSVICLNFNGHEVAAT
jgi:hypothetical protein